MGWRRAVAIGALALGVWAVPASACSVGDDYFAPSNFELVQLADAIAIATPAPAEEQPAEGTLQLSLPFRIDRSIKGAPPDQVEIDFAAIGPGFGGGMCNRSGFERGRQYLLFVARGEDGEWGRLGFPFAPDSEDYEGEDSAWMRAIRRYLQLQQSLGPMEQIAALGRMAETGLDGDGEPLPAAEREDIIAHLRSISPWKPTEWLLDLFARLERGDPLPFGPPLPPENPHAAYDRAAAELLGEELPEGSAGRALDEAVDAGPGEPQASSLEPLDPLRVTVLQALVLGEHPDAFPLFERLWAAPATDRRLRGLILRYFAANGQYARAYRWIETSLLAELRTLPRPEALALLRHVADVQRGDSWEEGRERWRSDPRAAATWPALSRTLYRYQIRMFGDDYALPFFDLE